MTRVKQSVVGVVIFFSHVFLHDLADAEEHAKFGQYCTVHMHAF